MYVEKWIYIIMMFLVIIGAINWGIVGAFDFNFVEKMDDFIGAENKLSTIVYVIIGLCGLCLLIKRDVFLPFLGDTAYPCDSLEEHVPYNSTEKVFVKVPPNSYVVYWASEPANEKLKELPNPLIAYKNYENAGVVRSDINGNAVLQFRTPQKYVVPFGKELQPHVHYRYCKSPGMLSRVETVFM